MNRLYQIALTKIKGIGPRTARNLLDAYGSAENIFRASKKELLQIPTIGKVTVDAIHAAQPMEEAARELDFVEKHRIELLSISDAAYPKRLLHCEDAPILLYYKGQANLNPTKCISIVGTRNATPYGKQLCDELIADLKEEQMDVQVVSGLAYGIDVQAHRQALHLHLPTIGVLGHGLDTIYPAAHREVAAQMLAEGGLLTEFPSGTIPDRKNFPARNRIIAGMADVTIVVEAAHKGGALITAEMANGYHRDVCAFPGRIDQVYSEGCNYLIKTNRAHLIRHAQDLLYLMGWESEKKAGQTRQLELIPPTLTKDQQRVYDYLLGKEQAAIDDIMLHLEWPSSKLAMVLLELEMNNVLLALPGKCYKLI